MTPKNTFRPRKPHTRPKLRPGGEALFLGDITEDAWTRNGLQCMLQRVSGRLGPLVEGSA